MSTISTTLAMDEVEEYDPIIYWTIVDELEDRGLSKNEFGEVEVIEFIRGIEVAVRNEEGDELFTLELDPEEYVTGS